MLTNVQFTPGSLEVLTLENAKKHLRVDINDEDELIQSYIDASVINCENFIGGHILPGSLVLTYDRFDNLFEFEAFPLKSITSVNYYASDVETTLDASKYALTKQNDKVYQLRFKEDTPSTDTRYDAVTITVSCGFPGDVIPKPIIQAIKLQLSDMYEIREDRKELLSTQAMSLLRPYKKY